MSEGGSGSVPGRGSERGLLIVLAAVLVLIGASIPLALRLDAHIDRQRQMFEDVVAMSWLQYSNHQAEGHGVALHVDDQQTVTVAGRRFTPSSGVVVAVRLRDDGYCVRGRNRFGDVSGWICGDWSTEPERPSRYLGN